MSTNIKVFKLVSGDEIIGSLIESQDDSIIKINQPMIFRTSTMMDNKGYPYDVTILKDWMIRSDVKIAEIPKVQVSTVFSPNEKTMNLYSLELKRLSETPSEEIVKAVDVMDNFIGADSTINDIMDNFINAMDEFADYQPSKNNSKKKKKKKPAKQQEELNLESFIPDEKKRKDFGNKFSDWNPDPESHDYE